MIPLPKVDYRKIVEKVKAIPFNTLFARMVLEGQIDGDVFVDDVEEPRSFYVLHSYGMSLLAGDSNNPEFNDWLSSLFLDESNVKDEYLQVYPEDWASIIKNIAGQSYHSMNDGDDREGKRIIEDTRINFTMRKPRQIDEDPDCQVVRTDRRHFDRMKGTVVPRFFWKDADDFVNNSVGFSALVNGNLASLAFAAFIIRSEDKKYLEIGIETLPEYYGKGLAKQACAALIRFCLDNSFDPTWTCRGTNMGSKRLAESLGFVESLRLGYWVIKRSQ